MPRAPKKCGKAGCETRVTGRIHCPTHAAELQWAGAGRGSTRQSRSTRAQVLAQWPTCYLQYSGCTITSTEDDHVIPLHRGGTDDMTNHRGACHHCHRIKTMNEARAARATHH